MGRCDTGVMADPDTALAEKRAALEAQLERMETSTDEAASISFGKRVGEGTNLAVERLSQVAAHERLHGVLTAVVRAQEKRSEGTYGACDHCGGDIGAARIEAMPWAITCIGCAAA